MRPEAIRKQNLSLATIKELLTILRYTTVMDRSQRIAAEVWRHQALLLALIACLASSIAVLWPILSAPSWYESLQGYRYPYLLKDFREQFLAGHFYPRWLPELSGGYGYPTFVYYPPGFWFVALLWSFLGLDEVMACKATLLTLFVAAGLGVYRLGRCWCGWQVAITCAVTFYLSPYFITQLYMRGCLAELAAGLVFPWTLFHLVQTARKIETGKTAYGHATWLATTVAFMLYMHPQVALWGVLIVFLGGLGLAVDSGRFWKVARCYVWAAVLSVALTAPYWFPVFDLADALKFQAESAKHIFFAHVSVSKLIRMDSQFAGPFLPLLAFVGYLVARRSWFIASMAVGACFLFWYVTPLSMWLRRSADVMYYLQHPIRVLSIFATLQALGIGLLLSRLSARIVPAVLTGCLLLAVMMAPAYKLRAPLDFDAYRKSKEMTFANMTHMNEFMPVGATTRGLRPRATNEPIVLADIDAGVETSSFVPGKPIVIKTDSMNPVTMVVQQFYFPGWRVEIDGVPASECPTRKAISGTGSFCRGPSGLLTILLPGGKHSIVIEYPGVPGALYRNVFTILVILACLVLTRVSFQDFQRRFESVFPG
jgi:hypothetical protein